MRSKMKMETHLKVALKRPNSRPGNLNEKVAKDDKKEWVENGGSLNPEWVEWLMGYPKGWTDLKPSETP